MLDEDVRVNGAFLDNNEVKVASVDEMKVNLLKEINQNYGQIWILDLPPDKIKTANWETEKVHPKYQAKTLSLSNDSESIDHLNDIKAFKQKNNLTTYALSIVEKKSYLDDGPGSKGKMRMKDFILKLASAENYEGIMQAIHESNILQGPNGSKTIYAALCNSFSLINFEAEDDIKNALQIIQMNQRFMENDLYEQYTKVIAPIFMRELINTVVDAPNDLIAMYPPIETCEFNTRQTLRRCLATQNRADLAAKISDDGINAVQQEQQKQSDTAYDSADYIARRMIQDERFQRLTTTQRTTKGEINTGRLIILKLNALQNAIYDAIVEEFCSIQRGGVELMTYDLLQGGLLTDKLTIVPKNKNLPFFGGTGKKGIRRMEDFLNKFKDANDFKKLAKTIRDVFSSVDHSTAKNIILEIIADNILVPMKNGGFSSLSELAKSKNASILTGRKTDFSTIQDRNHIALLALEQITGALSLNSEGSQVIQSNVEEFISKEWKLPVYISRQQQQLINEKTTAAMKINNFNSAFLGFGASQIH